jgi:hypothetical protein
MRRVVLAPPAIAALLTGLLSALVAFGSAAADDSLPGTSGDRRGTDASAAELPTVTEARGRAKLLHETIHATIQIVHHRYYREDEGLPIPALTLKDVFRELAEQRGVELRWLAVDAQAMNVEHRARDAFEKNAVEALAAGKEEFDAADNGLYRYAGVITLGSECLKCHLPNRTSTMPRAAGLTIAMPVRKD